MGQYQIPTREAKELVLARIATGMTATNAMKSVGRAYETWRDWRKTDPEFKEKAAGIKAAVRHGLVKESEVPDFPEFCAKYLGKPLPLHHLRAWDVVNGKPPRDWHDSMQYQPGSDPGRHLIINFPPDHAKSTVWNVEYPLWRIVKDPDVRIITVSKNQGMAKKFLSQIKFYLMNENLFPELHAAFAPKGGWKSAEKSDGLAWREDAIYVAGRTRPEKDPTLQALGVGGQIYGSRSDLIVLDDIEDYASAGLYESHADYIGQDVFSRLNKDHNKEDGQLLNRITTGGQLLILGTRVGVMDIYRYLRDNSKDEDGEPFYTYFAQPAILENEHAHSSEWKVLWPERMTAKAISSGKSAMTDSRRFQFVYQQRDVGDYATFPSEAVEAAINRRRFHGPMHVGASGHRPKGMHGIYTVGSWDPASSAGCNAMIVAGTDRETQHRWVMDIWNKKGALPGECIQLLKDWTVTYGINEWRIEKNAVQSFITQLPEIRDFLSAHGCRLVEHQTTANKWDPSMGVEGTLQPLFLSCVEQYDGKYVAKPDGHGLISLPSPRNFRATTELCEQLKQWEPEAKKLVQDLVMALWFAELGLRQYLRGGIGQLTHLRSKYTARGAVDRRVSYTIEDLHDKGLINAL